MPIPGTLFSVFFSGNVLCTVRLCPPRISNRRQVVGWASSLGPIRAVSSLGWALNSPTAAGPLLSGILLVP